MRAALAGRTSVFVGHSGVGKSTLVNALVPDARRATGHVNDVTGRGRHTSTSAVALRLPGGGWVIDTPGVRSFGLAHVQVDHLLRAFEDLDAVAAACPRGCTHLDDAPDCALDDWVADSPTTRPATPARRGWSLSGACSRRAPAPPEPAPRAAPPRPARAPLRCEP